MYNEQNQNAQLPIADLIGGRWLAWIGGASTLLGTVLLLALAISHGWIGRVPRVAMAAVGSAGLLGAGAWLREQRGRSDAAATMVGAGIAGLFATLVVAGPVYHLIGAPAALCATVLVGALATVLAIRWAGKAIGALGLLGGLLSSWLLGGPESAAGVAIVVVSTACALAVVVERRWGWLGVGALLLGEPQVSLWVLGEEHHPAKIFVLVPLAVLGLMGAAALQHRSSERSLCPAAAAMLAANALIAAVAGSVALAVATGGSAPAAWLFGLAGAHVALGGWTLRRTTLEPLRAPALALAVLLADVGMVLAVHGPALAPVWGLAAVAFGWLARRARPRTVDHGLAGIGLSGHIGLVLIRTLLVVRPGTLGAGAASVLELVTLATLILSCMVCAQLIGREETEWGNALNVLGLAAVAYLTASIWSGPELVAAWSVEAVALTRLRRGTGDVVGELAPLAFLAGASAHALVVEAPPWSLLVGAASMPAALTASIAVAVGSAAVAVGRTGLTRRVLLAAAAGVPLYLASVAIITEFQPAGGGELDLLGVPVRQQGQVVLSALWSLTGLAGLILALRRDLKVVRCAALALLLLSAAKVFVYDLSTLTSVYRVISFIVLGLLLLAGALGYQRLRPAPLPDLRATAPGER